MEVITANRASAILYWFLIHKNKPGDHYLLPVNICPEVVLVFIKAGIKISFVDLEPDNLGIDIRLVMQNVEKQKISGILYNHTYGNEFKPENFFKGIRNKYPEILLIDDKCLCTPEILLKNNLVDLTLYSTGPKKQIDLGSGGFAISKEKIQREPIFHRKDELIVEFETKLKGIQNWRSLSKLAISDWFEATPSNLDEKEYLGRIKEFSHKWDLHKGKIKEIYFNNIPSTFLMDKKYNNWRVQIRVSNKKELLLKIFRKCLFASDHFRSLGSYLDKKSFPVAEKLEKEVINLFIDHYFETEKAVLISDIIFKYGESAY